MCMKNIICKEIVRKNIVSMHACDICMFYKNSSHPGTLPAPAPSSFSPYLPTPAPTEPPTSPFTPCVEHNQRLAHIGFEVVTRCLGHQLYKPIACWKQNSRIQCCCIDSRSGALFGTCWAVGCDSARYVAS